MKTCLNCNHTNYKANLFCSQCAESLPEDIGTANAPDTQNYLTLHHKNAVEMLNADFDSWDILTGIVRSTFIYKRLYVTRLSNDTERLYYAYNYLTIELGDGSTVEINVDAEQDLTANLKVGDFVTILDIKHVLLYNLENKKLKHKIKTTRLAEAVYLHQSDRTYYIHRDSLLPKDKFPTEKLALIFGCLSLLTFSFIVISLPIAIALLFWVRFAIKKSHEKHVMHHQKFMNVIEELAHISFHDLDKRMFNRISSMDDIVCPSCNIPNHNSDLFCGSCSASLHETGEPAAAAPELLVNEIDNAEIEQSEDTDVTTAALAATTESKVQVVMPQTQCKKPQTIGQRLYSLAEPYIGQDTVSYESNKLFGGPSIIELSVESTLGQIVNIEHDVKVSDVTSIHTTRTTYRSGRTTESSTSHRNRSSNIYSRLDVRCGDVVKSIQVQNADLEILELNDYIFFTKVSSDALANRDLVEYIYNLSTQKEYNTQAFSNSSIYNVRNRFFSKGIPIVAGGSVIGYSNDYGTLTAAVAFCGLAFITAMAIRVANINKDSKNNRRRSIQGFIDRIAFFNSKKDQLIEEISSLPQ